MQHVVHHLVAAKTSNNIGPTCHLHQQGNPWQSRVLVLRVSPASDLMQNFPTSKQHVFSLWYLLLIRSLQLHSNPQNKNETNCVFEIFVAFSPSNLSIAPPSLRHGHTSPAAARRGRCSRQRPRRAVGCLSFERTGAASAPPSVSWLSKGAEEEHAGSSNM